MSAPSSAKSGPMLSEHGPISTKCGQCLAKVGPLLVKFGPIMTKSFQFRPHLGWIWPKLDRCRPKLGHNWSTSVDLGRHRTEIAQLQANFGRCRPSSGQSSGKVRPMSINVGLISAKPGPDPLKFRPSRRVCARLRRTSTNISRMSAISVPERRLLAVEAPRGGQRHGWSRVWREHEVLRPDGPGRALRVRYRRTSPTT